MKRTRKLTLTGLMAMGGVSLTACGDDPSALAQDKAVDAFAYQSLQDCKDKNEVPDTACETAEKKAADEGNADAKYGEQKSCEDVYGPGQCVPRGAASGGQSFWGPLLTGFVVGRMLDGAWGGGGMYRDWRGGGYYTRGGPVQTDYSTGRTRVGASSFDPPDKIGGPPKMQTRTSVVSRGGFGGRMSGRSYGGGGWGG